MNFRRLSTFVIGGALVAAAVTTASGSPASAVNVITVTTTADVVANDGLVSLREAFDTANADADASEIQLGIGLTYLLTECEVKEPVDFGNGFFGAPAEDDANADGDLDHTATDVLTIDGNGSTIENTCLYDRVVHNVSDQSRLVLTNVDITGGAGAPGDGSNVWSPGGATLTDVQIRGGIKDVGNQSAALVVGYSTPNSLGNLLTMTDSSILYNDQGGIRINHGDGVVTGSTINDNGESGITVNFGVLDISDTVLVDNGRNGVDGIDSAITATDIAAGNNGGFGIRNTGNAAAGQPLIIIDSNLIDNAWGGARCSYCTNLNVVSSNIIGNAGTGVSMLSNVAGPNMSIHGSTIHANGGAPIDGSGVATEGGGVEMEVESGHVATVTIVGSTISNNVAAAAADGGGVRLINAGLDASNSTITLNATSDRGGGISSTGVEPISLDFVTLVENTSAIGGSNLDRGGANLTSTATVIALPVGSVNCVSGALITSGGFNQADDNTCDFGGGTGDVAPAPNPMLGPLADNGGDTMTREPLAGSPLEGAVTGVTCTVAADDQRGVSRPQGPACEPGAVEVDETPMAMMVVGQVGNLLPDEAIADWLVGRGYAVTFVDDDTLSPAVIDDLAASDLVVVTSSVVPTKVGSQLADLPVPTLVTEGYLIDDFAMATSSGDTALDTVVVDVVDAGTGMYGLTNVYYRPHRLAYGRAGASAHIVAETPFAQHLPVAFTYDSNDPLVDGSAAPAARGAFFFDYRAPVHARPKAIVLLDYVLDRMLANP